MNKKPKSSPDANLSHDTNEQRTVKMNHDTNERRAVSMVMKSSCFDQNDRVNPFTEMASNPGPRKGRCRPGSKVG